MSELNPKLSKAVIQKVNIEIAEDIGDSFEMKAECRARILPPIEKNNTLLVTVQLKIFTPDEKWINISLESNIIFSLSYQPEEIDEEIEKAIMPLAIAFVFEKTDNILEETGHHRLGLKENLKMP